MIEAELEAGKEADIAMKKAVGAIGGYSDVAMAVEHGEAIAKCLSDRLGLAAAAGSVVAMVSTTNSTLRPGLVQMRLLAVAVDPVSGAVPPHGSYRRDPAAPRLGELSSKGLHLAA